MQCLIAMQLTIHLGNNLPNCEAEAHAERDILFPPLQSSLRIRFSSRPYSESDTEVIMCGI